MEQRNSSGQGRKGKHLTKSERVVIERMLGAGFPTPASAATLSRHRRTIEREITRGCVWNTGTQSGVSSWSTTLTVARKFMIRVQ